MSESLTARVEKLEQVVSEHLNIDLGAKEQHGNLEGAAFGAAVAEANLPPDEEEAAS